MKQLHELKGVGPKTLTALNNIGIYNVNDLVSYYPFRYNFIKLSNKSEYLDQEVITIQGVVETFASLYRINNRLDKISFRINSNDNIFNVIIFNRGFLKNNLKPGTKVTLIGKFEKLKNTVIVNDIKFYYIDDKEIIEPVYHSSSSISSLSIHKIINKIDFNDLEVFSLPNEIVTKYNFIEKKDALESIHLPKEKEKLDLALKRLKYEEAFTFFMKLKKLKEERQIYKGIKREVTKSHVEGFINDLPFKLTSDQSIAVSTILERLNDDKQMNVLLQGDVGSGKTIVAVIASYINYLSGYQTAFMVPTDVLAQQHYEKLKKYFEKINIKVALLTGKMKLKDKKKVHEQIKNKEVDLIIGTHALISESVVYNNLGLVITDEQHRFGVNQRGILKEKGSTPDVLYMSATPIPRTYALTLYNDMEVISIKTKPLGRKKIKTILKNSDEIKDVLTIMYDQLKQNHQIYVIAPLIEESEKIDLTNIKDLETKLNRAFGKLYKIGIMHGKMKEDDKNKIMTSFKENKINILISTTVVEVGVDIPNATVMVIFDSFRFGLSTLHQLRGRIGRSSLDSYCILISDMEKERLNILKNTDDGFEISEADFTLRGSGDLFGVRQSGEVFFKLIDIHKDYNLLETVKKDIELL